MNYKGYFLMKLALHNWTSGTERTWFLNQEVKVDPILTGTNRTRCGPRFRNASCPVNDDEWDDLEDTVLFKISPFQKLAQQYFS